MAISVDAVFQNGQLQLKQALTLAEGTVVHLTITPVDADFDPLAAVIGIGEGVPDGADNHDKYIYGKPER